jgi:pyruvate/2-oxoglutarate dehydrogenase complex dihydrolipoamide acyltransferase (E2) component
MAVDIEVPFATTTMEDGTITQWMKEDGDQVKAGEVVCLCDTDKAEVEIEAAEDGTLRILKPASEEPLDVGTVIGRIE